MLGHNQIYAYSYFQAALKVLNAWATSAHPKFTII